MFSLLCGLFPSALLTLPAVLFPAIRAYPRRMGSRVETSWHLTAVVMLLGVRTKALIVQIDWAAILSAQA